MTDLEYRVWTQYMLSADDFGVMRKSAVTIQADNDHLANRPRKMIDRCLETIVSRGLVREFEHQGRAYVYQHDWQDWQHVGYPRATVHPMPPPDALDKCSDLTRKLFGRHSSKVLPKVPKTSAPSRAREMAMANGKGGHGGNGWPDGWMEDLGEIYRGIYRRVRNGAEYHFNWRRDEDPMIAVMQYYGDPPDHQRFSSMFEIFLRMDPREVKNIPGTPAQFLVAAPECDRRLREAGQ